MKFFAAASTFLVTGHTLSSKLARVQASRLTTKRLGGDHEHAIDALEDGHDGVAPEHDNLRSSKRMTQQMLDSKIASAVVRTKPDPNFDVGILSAKQDDLLGHRLLATTCDGGYVSCTAGFVADGQTCYEACGGAGGALCCVGTDACSGFTGYVCKDGYSCFEDNSCRDATIGRIVHGCNGASACEDAGYSKSPYDPSFIGRVENGCIGSRACYEAAEYGGNITEIVNSCHGFNACAFAAEFKDKGPGTIAAIRDSCISDGACQDLAYDGGNVGIVSFSCNATTACFKAAYYYGTIGDISNSCHEESSCQKAGAKYGIITEIVDSCDGVSACYKVAYGEGGYVGGVQNSCNDDEVCKEAGSSLGNITSGIESCCNDAAITSCAGANATTLPATCGTSAPTVAPSKSPTSAPTSRGKGSKSSKSSKGSKMAKAEVASIQMKRIREHAAYAPSHLSDKIPSTNDQERT